MNTITYPTPYSGYTLQQSRYGAGESRSVPMVLHGSTASIPQPKFGKWSIPRTLATILVLISCGAALKGCEEGKKGEAPYSPELNAVNQTVHALEKLPSDLSDGRPSHLFKLRDAYGQLFQQPLLSADEEFAIHYNAFKDAFPKLDAETLEDLITRAQSVNSKLSLQYFITTSLQTLEDKHLVSKADRDVLGKYAATMIEKALNEEADRKHHTSESMRYSLIGISCLFSALMFLREKP